MRTAYDPNSDTDPIVVMPIGTDGSKPPRGLPVIWRGMVATHQAAGWCSSSPSPRHISSRDHGMKSDVSFNGNGRPDPVDSPINCNSRLGTERHRAGAGRIRQSHTIQNNRVPPRTPSAQKAPSRTGGGSRVRGILCGHLGERSRALSFDHLALLPFSAVRFRPFLRVPPTITAPIHGNAKVAQLFGAPVETD
jgi:hypothetical protein